MNQNNEKPSPEAKALSLFLMAFKSSELIYKEKSNRISKLWERVKSGKMSHEDYLVEVNKMLTSFGGYEKVLEKTVRFYIKKTGEWKLQGDDKYCVDAKEIADKILNK